MSAYSDALAKFRAGVLAQDKQQLNELATRYKGVYRDLSAQVSVLTSKIESAQARSVPITRSWVMEQGRLATLLAQVDDRIGEFSKQTGITIFDDQRRAVSYAAQQASGLIRSSLLDGGPNTAAQEILHPAFFKLNTPAVDELVGRLSKEAPLSSLLSSIAPQATTSVEDKLMAGLASGRNPRVIGADIKNELQVPLTRAQTIARTETIGASREASIKTYEANQNVVQSWQWIASLGKRTCPVCIAMHGTIHPVTESFGSHPNCRCSAAPVTKTWTELGFDVPEVRRPIMTGEQWFEKQTERAQLEILGPGKFELYSNGEIDLQDLVGYREDKTWGPIRWERPLKDLRENPKAFIGASQELPAVSADTIDFLSMAHKVLGENGGTLHYQELRDKLEALGVDIPRKNTPNGVLRYIQDQIAKGDTRFELTGGGKIKAVGEIKPVIIEPKPIVGPKPIIEPKPVVDGKITYRVHLSDGSTVEVTSASEQTAKMRAYKLAKERGLKVTKVEPVGKGPEPVIVKPEPVVPPKPLKPLPIGTHQVVFERDINSFVQQLLAKGYTKIDVEHFFVPGDRSYIRSMLNNMERDGTVIVKPVVVPKPEPIVKPVEVTKPIEKLKPATPTKTPEPFKVGKRKYDGPIRDYQTLYRDMSFEEVTAMLRQMLIDGYSKPAIVDSFDPKDKLIVRSLLNFQLKKLEEEAQAVINKLAFDAADVEMSSTEAIAKIREITSTKGRRLDLLDAEGQKQYLFKERVFTENYPADEVEKLLTQAFQELSISNPGKGNIRQRILDEIIYLKQPSKPFATMLVGGGQPAMQAKADEAAAFIAKMVKYDERMNHTIRVDVLPANGRCFASNRSSISMTPKAYTKIYVHEIGHALEYSDNALLMRSIAFRNRRTQGEVEQKLRDITGNKAYRDDEVTRPDKFIDPYIGKDYAFRATEVMSMGLEQLFADPVALLEKDEDFFRFIYDSARGRNVT